MPDSLGGAGDLFRSSILRQGLEDTQYPQQQIAGMMQGMQPEQMAAFFQNPEVQRQFQSFGIDPQSILQHTRQSPFLPNSFMQAHPHLGGIMSGAMANAAATPEAPLVSGAGSGISRAMQGMYGGPEMLRHYQLAQMMAPMGALGSMMPTFAEQRRRAIEEAIVKETQQRMQGWPQQLEDVHAQRTEPRIHQGQYGRDITEYHEGAPAGGAQGADLVQTGQRPPVAMLSPGMQGQQAPMPAYGLTPEQQAGWSTRFEPYTKEQQQALHPERQATADWRQAQIDAGVPEAVVDKYLADADKANAQRDLANRTPGSRSGGAQSRDYSKDYDAIRDKIQPQIMALEQMLASGVDQNKNSLTEDQKAVIKSQIDTLNRTWQDEIDTVDKQRGQAGVSRQERERTGKTFPKPLVPPVSPGASPGGAQAGGPGSQTSQGTAVAPQGLVDPYAHPQPGQQP